MSSPELASLIREAQQLPTVPAEAARAYADRRADLVAAVDAALLARPDLATLLGGNPVEVMRRNHQHHAAFMVSVFRFGQPELLARTVPWVYRAYRAQGFAFAYFPVELAAWGRAIADQLDPAAARGIGAYYAWLLARHDAMVRLAQAPPEAPGPAATGAAAAFAAALLRGDEPAALRLATAAAPEAEALPDFYLGVLQPAMAEVGRRWEDGEISVAHEHLATAIAGRVMTALYLRLLPGPPARGTAVVTAAPNERHDLGARVVADLLAMDGWTVQYLGANTPAADLLRLCAATRPTLVAISIAMPFGLEGAQAMVQALRQDPGLAEMRILVGGRIFGEAPGLWRLDGADACLADGRAAVALARRWGGGGGAA